MGDDNSAVVHNGIEEDGGGGQIVQSSIAVGSRRLSALGLV